MIMAHLVQKILLRPCWPVDISCISCLLQGIKEGPMRTARGSTVYPAFFRSVNRCAGTGGDVDVSSSDMVKGEQSSLIFPFIFIPNGLHGICYNRMLKR